MFRETCLVSRRLLNIARAPGKFFHAAVQRKSGALATLALFSNPGHDGRNVGSPGIHRETGRNRTHDPLVRWITRVFNPLIL